MEALLIGATINPEETRSGPRFDRAQRAVLFVDVVDSVRLIEQDEDGVIARWLRLREHAVTQILPMTQGRLVKALGDGMLLEFSSARVAIAAAFAIQQASGLVNAGFASDRQILLRMGIETGDIIVEQDDIYGRGVNLAARLLSLAGAGEIVISAQARDELTASLDADIEDLGECFLRNIAEPVRAYRVFPPGPRPMRRSRAPTEVELAPTIAVVPFMPRGLEASDGAIGEVIAEEIIRGLSHSRELSVISRLSTTGFRGRGAALDEIVAHLRADYVMSGVYGGDERRLILDVEFAETKSGRILFADRMIEDRAAILGGEQALISRLITMIDTAVVSRELQRSLTQPMPTLKTYTLMISAITLMHRLSPGGYDQAREMLQTLIERGVRHAVPQACLGCWHVLRVQQGWSPEPRRDAYHALECTSRALDIDPACSLALTIDGFVHTNLLKQLDVGLDRYEHATRSNPNDALAWLLKGTLHAFRGEGNQAVEDTQHALRLSPLDPLSYFYDSLAASACIAAGDNENALRHARQSLKANRKHTSTLRVLAVAQWRLGRTAEARATVTELLRLEPGLTVGGWLQRSPSADYAVGREFSATLRAVGVPD